MAPLTPLVGWADECFCLKLLHVPVANGALYWAGHELRALNMARAELTSRRLALLVKFANI
jgi:hypothetical protein